VGSALSDAQIVRIAGDANDSEVDQGRYALVHAQSAAVKRFAQHMVSAHADIGRKMTEMAKLQSIVPAPSPQSIKVHTAGRRTLDAMKESTELEFDRTYIDAQIEEHEELLEALDGKLIPSARNAELRTRLSKIRPMVAEHLKEAEDILTSMPPRVARERATVSR
jgi:putative membrane protein